MENRNVTWLRAVACIMVVSVHVCGYWYAIPNSPARLISLIGMGFSRPAVPLFAMLSGYLIFREDKVPSLALASKHFFTVLSILAYFGTLFYFYDRLTGQAPYPYWDIFFLVKNHIPLWYLFALLPAYTLSAYISFPIGKGRPFYRGIFALVFILFLLTQSLKGAPFYIESDYNFDPIFLYMILGFAIGQHKTKKPFLNYLGYLALSSGIVYLEWSSENLIEIYHGYGTILVLLQSIFFFRWANALNLEGLQNSRVGRGASFIANYSIGIFGWHFLLATPVKIFWETFFPSSIILIFLSYLSTLALSILISMGDKALWAKVHKAFKPLTCKLSASVQKYFASLIE